MTNGKCLRDVVGFVAPQGSNDGYWVLIEHQLAQCKMSCQIALQTLRSIEDHPENEDERKIAGDCVNNVHDLYNDILDHYASFLCYIGGTDVGERAGRVEL